MKTEHYNLEDLKAGSPFKVPEGYMKGLTDQIMAQLPEQPHEEPKTISMMERMRPWLYMAAVFAGLGLFFKVLIGDVPKDGNRSDSLIVKTNASAEINPATPVTEDEEYLEYLEKQYTDYLLVGEITEGE
ncbi:MAG: hypothetical protein RR382_05860 [Tannerellaceae bacterium]